MNPPTKKKRESLQKTKNFKRKIKKKFYEKYSRWRDEIVGKNLL